MAMFLHYGCVFLGAFNMMIALIGFLTYSRNKMSRWFWAVMFCGSFLVLVTEFQLVLPHLRL